MPRRTASCSGYSKELAMKYELMMLNGLLVTSMFLCGFTLFQMV